MKLLEADKIAKSYFDFAGAIMVTIAADEKVVSVNQKACEVLGYNEDEMIGRNWFESFISQEGRERVRGAFRAIIKGEIELFEYFENAVLAKNGEQRIIRWHNALVKDDEGRIEGSISSGEDVTARREMESKLRESEALFRNLYESSPIGIELYDSTGKLINVNNAVRRIFGVAAGEEIMGFKLFEDPNVSEESKEKLRQGQVVRYEAPFDFEKVKEYEFYQTSKSGIIYLDVLISPLYHDDGESPAGYLVQVQDVTERVLSQKKLEKLVEQRTAAMNESQELLELTFSRLEEAVLVNDPYTREIIRCNPTVEKIFGYKPEELVGTKSKFLHVSDKAYEDFGKIVASELDKKGEYKGQYDLRRKNGEIFSSEISVTQMLDDAGKRTGFVSSVRDLSRYREMLAALRESEEILGKTFASLQEAVFIINPETREIIKCNLTVEKIFGYKPEEVIGRPTDFLHVSEETFVEFGERMMPQLKKEGVFRTQYDFRRRNGEIFTSEIIVTEILDDEGNRTGVVESVRDMTEQQEMLEKLKSSEEKYRTLFEESKDGVFLADAGGGIIDFNPAAIEMFGYDSPDEAKGANLEKDLSVEPESVQRMRSSLQEDGFIKDYEMRMKKNDGSILDVSVTATGDLDKSGSIKSYRGVIRDVSAQKKFDQQMLHIQKMESMGRLTGGFAHSFNNLLMGMIGYTDMALMEIGEESAAYEDLREARSVADRAVELTRQLLMFSRKGYTNMRTMDMNQMIAGMSSMMNELIGSKYAIRTELQENLWKTVADSRQVGQVLLNLVLNARDSMPEGGEVRITTSNEAPDGSRAHDIPGLRTGNYIRTSVADSGNGISDEDLPYIFEPFFSTKEVRAGAGLGLTVAYGIISQHNGWIDVDSMTGKGTEVSVYLPASGESAKDRANERAWKAGKAILLVEDEDAVRHLAEKTLERSGYTVYSAAGVSEAKEVYEKHKDGLHIIFSDVLLPDGDGMKLVEELAAGNPKLDVIMASGYSSEKISEKEVLDKDYLFVQKPYSIERIREVIAGLMKR